MLLAKYSTLLCPKNPQGLNMLRYLTLFAYIYSTVQGSYQRSTGPGISLGQGPDAELPSDFVVLTEEGTMRGFDSCGRNIWRTNVGRVIVNANTPVNGEFSHSPRMVPAVDGSMYVVFPTNEETGETNIAHVNATIMSVVAESPFSTPAFPNSYLTGSKVQSIDVVDFDDSFEGWIFSGEEYFQKAQNRLKGRKLMYTTNQWMLSCIDTSSQEERWSLSFTDIPSMTTSHLIPNSVEQHQVAKLSNEIEIVTNRHQNRIVRQPGCLGDSTPISLTFDSQIVGVYALVDPPDTNGNLALVLVGKNTALPTNFGGLPPGLYFSVLEAAATHKGVPETDLLGIRVGYGNNGGQIFSQYGRANPNALAIRSPQVWDPSSMTPYLLADPGRTQVIDSPNHPPEFVVSQFRVLDFLTLKFTLLPWQQKIYFFAMMILLVYLVRQMYKRFLRQLLAKAANRSSSTVSIILPDRGNLASSTTVTISSPASTSSNRMVVIPSEAIHPYEVLTVGHSDTVEFSAWQTETDVTAFQKKIKDISDRLTKLPFAPSRKDYTGGDDLSPTKRQSIEESSNMTVLFLGRNVDEPKLVFRNPRAETVVQRPNIPLYTQSIRNAVASSALRDNASMKAYVPRALCGHWNTFQGIFQEYVVPNKSAKNVTISSLLESPQTAVDTAFLILLLRDTDAHEGNYIRDIRRKIALFDLGCSLADRPLPNDEIERMCLDNFELWKRVPFLLDCAFEDRHVEFLQSIDFEKLREMWNKFEYHQSIPGDRLVHPVQMVRMLEIHSKFLLECVKSNRTVLFAAEVMYSGMYDDVWLEVGEENIAEFETRLIELAKRTDLFPTLENEKGKKSERAKVYLESLPDSNESKSKDD